MNPEEIIERYRDLQRYVGWNDDTPHRIQTIAPLLLPLIPQLVEDFYCEIQRHPATKRVITGGASQVERLRGTLEHWLRELLSGQYDQAYVIRRWRVGLRHVEIGLDQVFTNAALSRLRSGLARGLVDRWTGEAAELLLHLAALHQVLDLDLAIIEDAYQAEYAARLQRTERLATLGQIAGGIAHELRNPLNVIKTSIYFLLHAKNITPEKRVEHLQRIERQVNLSDEVITALTNFARMPVPTCTPFDVVACLREILEHTTALKVYDVIMDFPSVAPWALGDASQMRIVFDNLIRNAREAMLPGGQLTLAVSGVGDRVEVSVRDTGDGIDENQVSQVMEPLYSTKTRGLGLGLAIARSIVEKNQGTIRVASKKGQGTTFTVSLRAVPPPSGGASS
jgi:signal transduction histidine kinase